MNIRPVFAACRAVVSQFRNQGGGGTIINLSSIAARTGGGGGSSLYAGSKAFIATFSRALAKEVASDRIRVNCVSPGVLATPMQDRTSPPEMLEALKRQIPLGRIGAAEECVGAFLWLCSEKMSGYVTGQVIEVNRRLGDALTHGYAGSPSAERKLGVGVFRERGDSAVPELEHEAIIVLVGSSVPRQVIASGLHHDHVAFGDMRCACVLSGGARTRSKGATSSSMMADLPRYVLDHPVAP